jgi:hypothetical protein
MAIRTMAHKYAVCCSSLSVVFAARTTRHVLRDSQRSLLSMVRPHPHLARGGGVGSS